MTHSIDEVIFHVASVLEVPVLIAALLALAFTLVEVGAFVVEVCRRPRRRFDEIEAVAARARIDLDNPSLQDAGRDLIDAAWSGPTRRTLSRIIADLAHPLAEPKIAKSLADFDFDAQRRLSRTRLLVRLGPALGLMGTLIPLSPALNGLAHGNVNQLSSDLRVAFSVTVLGVLIGALAFSLSLFRDRIYSQDLSDLEYIAAVLTAPKVDS